MEAQVCIPSGDSLLNGTLTVPDSAAGIVLFAHGSGSSRFSPRNQMVAATLQRAGLATLLIDLLTVEEEREDSVTSVHRFNISLLAARLAGATDWVSLNQPTSGLPVGYFGASTGSAAALIAAAQPPHRSLVRAIVSRGGRPDLAGTFISRVTAPTLFIVGGRDTIVIGINEEALKQLSSPGELKIVPGASHLFEEAGKLGEVAHLSVEWFKKHLSRQEAKVSQDGSRRPAS